MITPANSTPRRDFFSYESGRHLYNENLRFAERYVEFNVEALETMAARSVDRKKVTHIRKLAEGGFNRVFLLTYTIGTGYPHTPELTLMRRHIEHMRVMMKTGFALGLPQTTCSGEATGHYLKWTVDLVSNQD